jgi:hypothetical protein
MFKHQTFSLGLGAIALTLPGAAMAQVRLGVNIGIPAPVYMRPAPAYAPPPRVYAPAPVIAGPGLFIGWHGDRYWDGHRYWSRRDWYVRGHHDYRRW